MAYHPRVQGLPQATNNSRVWASIGDENTRYFFLIVPETITYSHTNSVEKLPVAYTNAELIKFKNSAYTINIPNIKFWTRDSNRNLTEDLQTLVGLVRPVNYDIQQLSFNYGSTDVYPVYIESFSYSETRRTGGNITEAEGQMKLLVGYELDSSEVEKLDITNLDLTLRQRQQKAAQADEFFQNNPQRRSEFKVEEGKRLVVDGSGNINQGGDTLLKLSDIGL